MLERPLTSAEFCHFDVKSTLGCTCLLEIEHAQSARGRTYGKVVSLIAAPEGVKVPDLHEEFVFFELSPTEFKKEIFDSLPSWERDRIEASEDWGKLVRTLTGGGDKQAALPAPPVKRPTTELIDDDLPDWS